MLYNKSITHNNHIIEIYETVSDFKFSIKKDGKLIFESENGYPFPSDAEVDAKLYINRIMPRNDGWIIS